VLYKGWVIFKHNIPKKHKRSGIKTTRYMILRGIRTVCLCIQAEMGNMQLSQ
jgi:hypothetical protein